MNQKIHLVYKFDNVPNNSVFRIETEFHTYIFKVYSKRDWPEDGKLPYIARKLKENNIPHAHLFIFSREDENFPNGYLIEELLPGTTADRLMLSGEATINLFTKLAVLVAQVHQIEKTGYGYIGSGVADYTSFSEFMHDVLKDNIPNLTIISNIDTTELNEINMAIYDRLKRCDIFPSVLCHGDLSTKNIIVHSGEITLIDWDDAQSLCWMADISRLTFWTRMNYDEQDAFTCRKAFLDCYESKYDKNIFFEMEDILHVWYGLDYLTFFTKGQIKEKVTALIHDSREKCKI